MGRAFPHSTHLVRMGLLLAAGLLAFAGIRRALVPKGFGELGHYRTGALADNRDRVPVHAGQGACQGCHGEVQALREGTRHARLSCEGCHGPQGVHAEDPSQAKPPRPAARPLCLRCHQALLARPRGFRQIEPKDHPGEACLDCHSAHAPGKERAS